MEQLLPGLAVLTGCPEANRVRDARHLAAEVRQDIQRLLIGYLVIVQKNQTSRCERAALLFCHVFVPIAAIQFLFSSTSILTGE